jgi:hypothetical protein
MRKGSSIASEGLGCSSSRCSDLDSYLFLWGQHRLQDERLFALREVLLRILSQGRLMGD